MLTTGRGVRIKPKEDAISGNLIIFSATSNDETAHPYEEKSHGLFTYFLLKKLKESGSNISVEELFNYIRDNVARTSVINNKPQNPKVNVGSSVKYSWTNRKLR